MFCFWFFSWVSFFPAPEYPNRTVSNFFANSQRYSCTTGINDTGGKFCLSFASVVATGVNDTGDKIWKQYQAADS